MASEKDFELLDDYLGNRLKGPEKETFEERLKADSELQGEYRVQQHIVESIRKTRAAELKQMLNNIPLSSIPRQTSSFTKWTGAASAIVIAAALYFYLKPDQTETSAIPSDTTSIPVPAEQPESTAIAPEKITPIITEDTDSQKFTDVRKPSAEKSKDVQKTNPARTESKPNIDVFDPSTEEESDSGLTRTEIPRQFESRSKSSIPTEVNSNNKTYSFHYQFKEQKLILYGAFDKNLYEILEFISGDNAAPKKRTIFLYYKSNYYLLNQSGEKIKPLNPVTDPALLQKLKESRNQP